MSLADTLVRRFQATFTEPPSWAWPFEPSVSLVGHNYEPGRGLLLYASAENLAYLNAQQPPPYLSRPDVWNRYRVQYEQLGRVSGDFFPYVGIQPVNDGGLLAAALFVAERLGLPTAEKPREFLETIAVTNWCKFTIKAERNVDYIGNLAKLTQSLPFVVGELAELQPAVVLLPKQLWRREVLRAAMRGASPRTRFLPVPQFNSTVVNTHLQGYTERAGQLWNEMSGAPLAEWMANLRRFKEENAWRYIAFLDERLGQFGSPAAPRRNPS